MKNVVSGIALVTEVRVPRPAAFICEVQITKLWDNRKKFQVIEDCEASFILRIK